jgi:potassium-transporting ATPase KdpC subunit
MMRRQLVPAILILIVFTVLTGLVYPLAVTGVAQVAFPNRADGSLLEKNGTVIGSKLIGQNFTAPRYFQPRPSAAGDGYDGMSSSPSNLGPTNPVLIRDVQERVAEYRRVNGVPRNVPVPVDAVTASGSGLDPDISPANARLQAPRVARARGLLLRAVMEAVDDHTDGRSLGFLGERGVNVLELNLALDSRSS